MTAARGRIGVVPDLVARPLFSRFREPEFDVVRDVPGALGVKLRERQLDGAFLSPFDVARSPGGCRPAGGGSLVARPGSNTARLLFRSGIREIRTLSVDPGRISEIVLAHLVLVEQYDVRPQIVPRTGTASEAMFHHDAVLVAGDQAADPYAVEEGLDLVDEWLDMTDLPFVHGLWYLAQDASAESLEGVFECPAPDAGPVSYRFDDDARAGVAEFVRMAYYHGILGEIPEFSAFLPESPG
jgi:predicted solute-binding protein